MSYFAIRAPFPALRKALANNAAELISSFRRLLTTTASLKEAFFGAERFKIGRTLFFCLTAIRGLTRKFSKGGVSKGPATILLFTQSAIVSVNKFPCSKADFALSEKRPGKTLFNVVSAPRVTVLKACFAIFL